MGIRIRGLAVALALSALALATLAPATAGAASAQEIDRDVDAALADLYAKHLAECAANRPAARRVVGVGLAPAPKGVNVVELAGWTSVARAILNLPEVITRS